MWEPIFPIIEIIAKKNIEASKHETRATDPYNSAKCIELYGESDGTSPLPQNCQKIHIKNKSRT